MPAFEQETQVRPAVLGLYTGFRSPPSLGSLNQINAAGAIPLVAWSCASVTAISQGDDDASIKAYADRLRSFGHPLFLRWFWEMNLPGSNADRCLSGSGPAEFVSAWRHIWAIFQDERATNVAFVWCPGASQEAAAAPYFPGTSYVDWIGGDGYDRKSQGVTAFSTVFGAWYAQYAPLGKPMMIAETGAPGSDQAAYLQGLGSVLPTSFRQIKAVVYFDASGPAGDWRLTAAGATAFLQLSDQSYFSYRAA